MWVISIGQLPVRNKRILTVCSSDNVLQKEVNVRGILKDDIIENNSYQKRLVTVVSTLVIDILFHF